MKTVLVSKFDLKPPPASGLRQIPVHLPSLASPAFLPALFRALRQARAADAILASNPRFPEFVLMFLAKLLYRSSITVMVFDLIMHAPHSTFERLKDLPKAWLLRAVDWFAFIHRDTSGYEKHFGIRRERCLYVPFKANNFELAGKIAPVDGDYILSLGASQRDYQLLVDAVTGLDIKLKILLPMESIRRHNAIISRSALPPNVEHVSVAVDYVGWSRYMAESRFVVIPLLPGIVQPAGISVYLEAMVLGKPVVISRGSSTEGILDDELAVLVTPGSVEAMRDAVISLWNDAARRRRLSERGQEYALGLKDHDRLVDDLRRLIDEKTATGSGR